MTFRLTFPDLPDGRVVDIPDRGPMFVRDLPGPPGAPTVLLVHGWMATADLNWGFTYRPLTDRYRVVAVDLHGHGRGLASRRRFDFGACADDLAAVADTIGVDRAVVTGYSMGGPIALEFARRHPTRTHGLVLCATAGAFSTSPVRRKLLRPLGPLASATRFVPEGRWRTEARRRFIAKRATGQWREWITSELLPSDLTTVLEAGVALSQLDVHPWVGSLEVPSAVVVTEADTLVAPAAQDALFRALPDARRYGVDGDHVVCFEEPDRFVPALLTAVGSVTGRAG